MKLMTIAYKEDPPSEMLYYRCLNVKKIYPDSKLMIVVTKELENATKDLVSNFNHVEVIPMDLDDTRPLTRWKLIYHGYKIIKDDIMHCGPLTFFKKDIRPILNLDKVNILYSKIEMIHPDIITHMKKIVISLRIKWNFNETVHNSFMFLPANAFNQLEKINSLIESHQHKLSIHSKDLQNIYIANYALFQFKDQLFLLKDILKQLTNLETNKETSFMYNTQIEDPYLLYTYPHEFEKVKHEIPI